MKFWKSDKNLLGFLAITLAVTAIIGHFVDPLWAGPAPILAMATIGSTALTLSDWSKRLDPDGSVAAIVEMLNQTNEILTDMMWVEGNLPTGHRTTVRTGLPGVAWRLLNYGVVPTKSATAQVDDACGMLEAYSEVDKDLAMLNGNLGAFRLSEARSFLEAMNQEQASVLFYGNTAVTPNKYLGLSARYSTMVAANAANAVNVIDGGSASGQTDNTSVWLVTWGDQTCHGIFPKGSKAGLVHEDLGIDTVIDAAGGRFQAYRDHFQWKCGISLRDWRYVVRICNIDVSLLVANGGSQVDLVHAMIKAMNKIPTQGMGKAAFYMNRTVYTMLQIQALAKSSSALAIVPAANQFELQFFGIPIRKCDALLNTESRVV